MSPGQAYYTFPEVVFQLNRLKTQTDEEFWKAKSGNKQSDFSDSEDEQGDPVTSLFNQVLDLGPDKYASAIEELSKEKEFPDYQKWNEGAFAGGEVAENVYKAAVVYWHGKPGDGLRRRYLLPCAPVLRSAI